MAAYAALVSVMHIIQQIQNHPRPPISLDVHQLQSLTENVTFLQDYLESNEAADGGDLNSRIADVAYAAEDIIESHIVDQIQAQTTRVHDDLYQGVQKVIQDLDLIKRDVSSSEKKINRNYSTSAASSFSQPFSSTGGHNTNTITVGFNDVLIEIMDKLTGGQRSNRQIIPIVGMGGIGKTTLAKNVYVNPLVVHHFDLRAWVTISQEFSNSRDILLEFVGARWVFSQESEDELGEMLYKMLSGRRYLIVMDDMWSNEAWEKVRFFFPDNNNGSGIIITTRLSNMASQLTGTSPCIQMKFLDEAQSWSLLCKHVFGSDESNFCCPLELEEIGKEIARNCKGLPLSIAVIGGILAKSQRTRECWEYINENLNSIVNSTDDERCLKILSMSYKHLPVHLKPCFLYMGMFLEDAKIHVSPLIRLWVAEGFLKPIHGKTLEMVAEEYLNDLVYRNLILVDEVGAIGEMKICKMHDLLRDLCLRQIEKEKFLHSVGPHNVSESVNTQRRVSIHLSTGPRVHADLKSAALARSLVGEVDGGVPLFGFRLLRVWNVDETNHRLFFDGSPNSTYPRQAIFQLVNLRHLIVQLFWNKVGLIPSSVHLLWNLQTIILKILMPIKSARFSAYDSSTVDYTLVVPGPFQIWKMPRLRHVEIDGLKLPDPPSGQMEGEDGFVLENLQTLATITNFNCGEEVIKRVPIVKELRVSLVFRVGCSSIGLGLLQKLESLTLDWTFQTKQADVFKWKNLITFPRSLKKLSLTGPLLDWDDMMTTIGSLPLLELLKLHIRSFEGGFEWETVDGQFQSLKYLKIQRCCIDCWRTESTHFPRLERLVLKLLNELKEIPSEIGDIPTLKSIVLKNCTDSAVISANEILKEQEELGNVDLQVRAWLWLKNKEIQRLSSPNFIIYGPCT